MAKVTVNEVALPDKARKLGEALSLLTRTREVGGTALSVIPHFGIRVDLDSMLADCPNLDAIKSMADADAVVRVIDEGKTPRPRTFTWGAMVERLETVIAIAPYLQYAKSESEKVRGLVQFDNVTDGSTSSTSNEIDFSMTLG
jgi:hypothetical protein